MEKKTKMVRMKNIDAFAKTAMYPSSLENNKTGIPENGMNVTPSIMPTATTGMSVRLEQGKPPVYIDNDTNREIVVDNIGTQSGPFTEVSVPDHYVEKVRPPKELLDKYTLPEISSEKSISAESTVKESSHNTDRSLKKDKADPESLPVDKKDFARMDNIIHAFKTRHGLPYKDSTLSEIMIGFLESRMKPDYTYNTVESIVQLLPTNVLFWAIDQNTDWAKLCLTHQNQRVKSVAIKKLFNLSDDTPPEIVEAYINGFLAASK